MEIGLAHVDAQHRARLFAEFHHRRQQLRIGQNVKEIIECDLASEIAARTLYQEAATHCHGVKDYVSRDLFESLMKDEEHHIDFLETQLDLIKRIGLELYTQKHVGGLEGGS